MHNLPLDAAPRAFLEALFGQWQLDPVHAALRLRAYSDAINPEIVKAAREYATYTLALYHAARGVEAHPPASPAVPERSLALAVHSRSANRFADVIALVQRTSGDPRAADEVSSRALDVLEGRIAATAALVTSGAFDDAWRRDADAVLRLFDGIPPELDPVLAETGLLAAALALPHEDVIAMFGWQAAGVEAQDFASAERLRYGRAPERTAPDSSGLRLVVVRVGVLVQNGRRGDDVARVLVLLDRSASEIADQQVSLGVRNIGAVVLQSPLSQDARHELALAVARAALRSNLHEAAANALRGAVEAVRSRLAEAPEPLRSALALEFALALTHAGDAEQARPIAREIDMAALARTVPPITRWLTAVQEQLEPVLRSEHGR